MVSREKIHLRGPHGRPYEIDVAERRAAMPVRPRRRARRRVEQVDDCAGVVPEPVDLDGRRDLAELEMRAGSKVVNGLLATAVIGGEVVLFR
jgi:hypothetical protein